MCVCQRRCRTHHPGGATRVESDRSANGRRRELAFERKRDDAPLTETAVLCRENEANAELVEPLQIVEVGGGSPAVEQRRFGSARLELFCERQKRSQADTSGDQPRLIRWSDDGERPSEGPQAVETLPNLQGKEYSSHRADGLVQKREAFDLSVVRAKHFED